MSIIGAIRWDGWYYWSPGSVQGQEQKQFSAAGLQPRAPWFAQVTSPYWLTCVGTQANVDLECQMAAAAGIDYWQFGNYQPGSPLSPADTNMSLSWTYYQASPNKNLVHWCWRTNPQQWQSATFSDNTWQPFLANMASAHCTQSNYQKVMSNRPLVYINYLSGTVNAANMASAIGYFRSQCTAAGLGSPYVVLQDDEPAYIVTPRATSWGVDAVANYSVGTLVKADTPASYDVLDTGAKSVWAQQAAAGKVVPTGISGWDLRCRLRVPEGNSHAFPRMGDLVYFTPPSEARVAQHISDLMAFVAANPTACDAQAALLYSWTECSEGGRALIPTIGDPPQGTNGAGGTNLLTAIKGVLRP